MRLERRAWVEEWGVHERNLAHADGGDGATVELLEENTEVLTVVPELVGF